MTSAKHRLLRSTVLAAALLALGTVTPLRAQVALIPVPSTATYQRADRADSPLSAVAVALAPLGITPGMVLDMRSMGDWNNGPGGDIFTPLNVVFSSSTTLLSRTLRYRVPGAIGVGRWHYTAATCPSADSLDIPEDFGVDVDTTIIVVPPGAAYLFVETADCFWVDNTDPDADLKLKITTLGFADVTGPSAGVPFAAAPNPFARTTTLNFALARDGDLRLAVYDVTGRLQRTLANGGFAAGVHSAAWDGRDDAGRLLPRGSYFVRVEDAAGARTVKVTRVE